jgi:hypothetical protein
MGPHTWCMLSPNYEENIMRSNPEYSRLNSPGSFDKKGHNSLNVRECGSPPMRLTAKSQ